MALCRPSNKQRTIARELRRYDVTLGRAPGRWSLSVRPDATAGSNGTTLRAVANGSSDRIEIVGVCRRRRSSIPML